MSKNEFLDDIIHQGEIAHRLSKFKKEDLIIGYQQEILLNEEKDKCIAELEEENEILKQSISKFNDNSIRYSISNFDIANDEMRYKIVCDFVERIKELKEENKELKELAYTTSIIFSDGYDENGNEVHNIEEVTRTYKELFEEQREIACGNGKLYRENHDLKHQLKSLSKRICEEIREKGCIDCFYVAKSIPQKGGMLSIRLNDLSEIQAKYEKELDNE